MMGVILDMKNHRKIWKTETTLHLPSKGKEEGKGNRLQKQRMTQLGGWEYHVVWWGYQLHVK